MYDTLKGESWSKEYKKALRTRLIEKGQRGLEKRTREDTRNKKLRPRVDSGAKYRVTFVMVTAETSTSDASRSY